MKRFWSKFANHNSTYTSMAGIDTAHAELINLMGLSFGSAQYIWMEQKLIGNWHIYHILYHYSFHSQISILFYVSYKFKRIAPNLFCLFVELESLIYTGSYFIFNICLRTNIKPALFFIIQNKNHDETFLFWMFLLTIFYSDNI